MRPFLLAGLLLALFCCARPAPVFAMPVSPVLANPFGVPGMDQGERRRPAQRFNKNVRRAPGASRGPWSRFQRWIIDTQRQLHGQLTGGVRALKTGNPWLAIWSLALISFIYGVVHAVGPGHGKAVITSYVFANERTLKRGIILAVLSSLMQAVTAVTAVSVLAIALNATGMRIQAFAQYLEAASYALVALIGAWLLYTQGMKMWRLLRGNKAHDHHHHEHHNHDHHHHHDHPDPDHVHSETCGCGHDHIPAANTLQDDDWSWQKALSIIVAIGLRPCTGAIIVLVFAFVNGLFWAGVASTFAMAVGTAITISSLAILAVGSKQLALRIYGEQHTGTALVLNGLTILAALFVLFLGLTLFIDAMGPARPFG